MIRTQLILVFFLMIFFVFESKTQDYILGGGLYSSFNEKVFCYLESDNSLYIVGVKIGPGFPTTDGSTINGGNDAGYFFLKYNATTMQLQEARLIGQSWGLFPKEIRKVGSNIYIFGHIEGPGLPSTIGSGHSGSFDCHILKLDLDGNVVAGTYLGGSSIDHLEDVEIVNGIAHFISRTGSSDYPVTDSTTQNSNSEDLVYNQFDLSSMTISLATYIGGDLDERKGKLTIDGTNAFIGFETNSTNLPVTDSSSNSGSYDLAIAKLETNTGGILGMTYLGGSSQESMVDLVTIGGEIFIQANSSSNDFTSTNGSYYQPTQYSDNVVFARYDTNFTLQASAYVFVGVAIDPNLEYDKGFLYMAAENRAYDFVRILKLDVNGNVLWDYSGMKDVSPNGKRVDLKIHNDKVVFSGIVDNNGSISTNGSSFDGNSNFYFSRLTLDGNLTFASYYGGPQSRIEHDSKEWLQLDSSKVWLVGTGGPCFPVTNGSGTPYNGIASLAIETCASNFQGDPAHAAPTQVVCRNGVVQEIELDHYLVSGANLPLLDVCGTTIAQRDIYANYQWQSAPSSNGPWTDILGATNQNYTPFPVFLTTYYRRIATHNECCGGQILQVSDLHRVIVGSNDAPVVSIGGIYNTCPGTAITIASNIYGGQAPFQFQWTVGSDTTVIGTAQNLTTTPSAPGAFVYTLTVIDAAGCMQFDQAIVNAYSASAGNNAIFCKNQPGIEIGGPAIPGLSGVVYNWSPPTGLSCTNCPNPTATPTSSTQYTLTLTIPVTGGGTCSTTDMVTVSPINGPSPNFAGPDKVICFGSTTLIGNPAEYGFAYTWAPGANLTCNTATPTVFDHGNIDFPIPNPITYFLTAEKQGCTWFDQMEVAVIKADVGTDDSICGPTIIGKGDETPNINETWQWTKLSGDGMITGATNAPITTVSFSTNITSTYELAVTYNGTTCKDTATIIPCLFGSSCTVQIDVLGGIGCPSAAIYDDVCIRASISTGPLSGYTVSWSPQVGLDAYSGSEVCLTDTVFRTYTATMTNNLDTSIVCTATIAVNVPAWSKPVFSAQEVSTCANQPVHIGDAIVAGYSYNWSDPQRLDNYMSSNPQATVPNTSSFIVTVTDVLSGCQIMDTATVNVSNPYAVGGPDQLSCNSGVFALGSAPTVNNVYSWTPVGANWQNGTNQNSTQPDVLVAINTTFVLTATDTVSGCVAIDTVQVDVGQAITPFTLSDVTYCPAQANVTLGTGIATGPGVSYAWSPILNLSNPNAAMPTVAPIPSNGGVYSVIVTNASGCSYQTTQAIVPSVPAPIVSSQSICVGESVQIGSPLNPIGPGISYLWSPTIGLNSATSPNPTLTANVVGTTTYTLTVMENGCSNSSAAIVTVHEFPISIPPKTICVGSCVNIGIPSVPGATYIWSPISGLNDPTIANPLACVNTNSNTVYTLVATGPNGCITTVQVPVFTNANQAPQVTMSPSTFCLGTSGNTINPTVSPPANYTYNWAPNNGTLIYPNSPSPEVVLPGPGTVNYQVTITNVNSGCATVAATDVSMVICDPNVLCQDINICLELSIDPNHPITTMDCDGDGVTNATECDDSTDPLDPCDYLSPSITLPVTADQSNCPQKCTDLTPTVKIIPGNIVGNSLVQVAIKLTELHNVDTDGTIISVRVPSDPRLLFVWDIGLTYAAFTPVRNADWNYLGDNGVFHNWTYNGPSLIINAQSTSAFGFYAFYDPQGTDGQTNITATVVPFSGGECNLINNSDSELLIYFR